MLREVGGSQKMECILVCILLGSRLIGFLVYHKGWGFPSQKLQNDTRIEALWTALWCLRCCCSEWLGRTHSDSDSPVDVELYLPLEIR